MAIARRALISEIGFCDGEIGFMLTFGLGTIGQDEGTGGGSSARRMLRRLKWHR